MKKTWASIFFAIVVSLPHLCRADVSDFIADLISKKKRTEIALKECVFCSPKESAFIQNKKINCFKEYESNFCEQLKKKYPEVTNDIMKCDEKEICMNEIIYTNYGQNLLGCVNGAWDSVADIAKFAFELLNPKEVEDLEKKCNQNDKCRAELKKADEDFGKNSMQARMRRTSILNQYFPSSKVQLPKINPSEFKKIQQSLMQLAEKEYQSMKCFNAYARSQLGCYLFFSMLDPIAAAAWLKNDVKLKNIVEVYNAERRLRLSRTAYEAEELKYFAHPERSIARRAEQESLVKNFLFKESSSLEEREAFVRLMNQPGTLAAKELPASQKRIFFEYENAALKRLNDSLKDKDLVTAIGNFAKENLNERITAFAKSQKPPLKIYRYSDGKTITVALEGNLPADISDKLKRIFEESNNQFSQNMLQKNIVRKEDDPKSWFRGGIGQTVDEANLAARYSRGAAGENSARNFLDAEVRYNLGVNYDYAKLYFSDLQKEPSLKQFVQNFLSADGQQRSVFNSEFFEVIRKYPDPIDLQLVMKNKYGVDIPDRVANNSAIYAKIVDDLNPKVLVADQSVVTLSDAAKGGLTMDRKGMGALNQEATARAIEGSRDFSVFPIANRKEEQRVTHLIETERASFEKATGGKSRGDDSVLAGQFSVADKQKIISEPYAAHRRIAFIPEGIAEPAARLQLATHGEGLEKAVSKILDTDSSYKKLAQEYKELRFAVDMTTRELGKGPVSFLVNKPGGRLSSENEQMLREVFAKAVNNFNQEIKDKTGFATSYLYKP